MTRPLTPNHAFRARGSVREGSLQNRIRQFFLCNPDEELTYPDICVKFDCTLDQAHSAVRELVKRDGSNASLQSVHVVRGVQRSQQ